MKLRRRIRARLERRRMIKRWGTTDLGQIRTMQQRAWQQQVHEASGRWARSVADVSSEEWKRAMQTHRSH